MYTFRKSDPFHHRRIEFVFLYLFSDITSRWTWLRDLKTRFLENVSERFNYIWGIGKSIKLTKLIKTDDWRLFFMMGLNWYLEIFSSLMFNIRMDGIFVFFLDTVNMLQGVWVFGNFISQGNITEALLKALNLITRST